MKSIDLFCASPASTAICSNMDHRAIVRPGTRPIDRHIHRLGGGGGDTPRTRTNAAPCSSHLPFDPSKPFYNHKSSSRKNITTTTSETENLRRKSSADVDDLAARSPSRSSRYLLSDKPFLDIISSNSSQTLMIRENNYSNNDNKRLNLDGFPSYRSLSTRAYENPVYEPSSKGLVIAENDKTSSEKLSSGHLINEQKYSSSSPRRINRQVVELRVSIHCKCKGCEGKLKKHISRMEGVESFSIDLERRKVTVIGDVTPLGVLASICKVKNAQFWPSPSTTTSSSSSASSPRVSLTR